MLIGKTFWKNLAMSSFLHATEITTFTAEEIQKHQKIENEVFRNILQVPTFVAAASSEVGASSTRARDMKSKLSFVKHVLQEQGNELLKRVFLHKFEINKGEYISLVKKYMKVTEMTLQTISLSSVGMIKNKVNTWDSLRWREEIAQKETLRIYRKYKENIDEVKWFDNTQKSKIMMQARLNVLPLNWRKEYLCGNITCPLCNVEVETLEHFLLNCTKYEDLKMSCTFLTRQETGDVDDKAAEMLLMQSATQNIEDKKELIYKMFSRRRNAQKEREEGEQL